MVQLKFPTTWVAIPNEISRVTHRFRVLEQNDKTSQILMTMTRHSIDDVPRLISVIQGLLTEQIDQERPRIYEDDVVIHRIKNENGIGFYFMVTDKTWFPASTDWPYLMRCFYLKADLLFEISVLCYDAQNYKKRLNG